MRSSNTTDKDIEFSMLFKKHKLEFEKGKTKDAILQRVARFSNKDATVKLTVCIMFTYLLIAFVSGFALLYFINFLGIDQCINLLDQNKQLVVKIVFLIGIGMLILSFIWIFALYLVLDKKQYKHLI